MPLSSGNRTPYKIASYKSCGKIAQYKRKIIQQMGLYHIEHTSKIGKESDVH